MAATIQLRRDLAATWTSANPVLAQGEVGLELDTRLMKIGDGTTAWNSLPYASISSVASTGINDSTADGRTLLTTSLAGQKTHLGAAEAGTGYVYAPALIKNQGASSTLAAAMEALSTSMSRNGKITAPTNPEQGVIEIGHGAWTLERTAAINLTGAGVSRFGLTIRGQGDSATIIRTATTASTANFKGGDNIWRMFNLTANGSGKFERFTLENLEVLAYFTQGGDGTTRLTDDLRIIDTDYLVRANIRNVRAYARTITAQSTNQVGLYLKRAYYANVDGYRFNSAAVPAAGIALNNASAVAYGGTGLTIEECNSLQVRNLEVTGAHTGAVFTNDDGAVINGFHMEHVNRGFHFENGTYSAKALNGYIEFHFSDSADIMLPRDSQVIASFGATTRDNLVTVANGQSLPRIKLYTDRSRDRSNKVVVEGQYLGDAFSAKALTGTATTSSVTVSTSTDSPPDFRDQSSEEIAWPGTFGQARYYTHTVDPRAGRMRVITSVRRISGDGMMKPLVTSVGVLAANTIYDGDLLDVHRRLGRAGVGGSLSLAASGHSYSASNNGEVTWTFTRPHLLQAGMRQTTSGTIGTAPLASGTNLYVRSVTSETVAVFGIATGTLADPGTVTAGTLTTPSDMYEWLGQEDATRNWLNLDRSIPLSFNVIGLSLTGGNIPVITLDRTVASCGITNTSKLMLWGFNDSRLDGVAYTALTADISGSTITLNALGAMATLDVTTAAANGNDTGATVYGKIGFTEVLVSLIGKTTGAAACVWRWTEPKVFLGDSLSMPVLEGVSSSGGAAITVQDEGSSLATAATILNFTGAGVTASGTGSTKTIDIPGAGTATITVKENGTNVSTGITSLDFLGADFDVTESPAGEANVVVAAAIARLASPALTGTPTAPTAAAATNTTQIATTAHVFAERTNTATLTGKTISGASNTLTALPAAGISGVIPIANLATGTPDGSKFIRDDGTLQSIPGGGDALVANPLSQFAATTSAQLAGVLTDETGSGGGFVRATSPTLVTPILGTPTSVTLTNATGLPVATGISGLGTNVATFLATPSSANLAAALTDETGTGSNVFATAPTISALTATGLFTHSGAEVVAPNAMGALAIDVTRQLNTKTISADSTLTFSATATTDAWFGLHLSNSDTAGHAITIPSSYSMTRNATVTSFVIPASSQLWLIWRYDGTTYRLFGEPGSAGLNNFAASTNPGVGDDSADGYGPGSLWVNTTTPAAYICITAGAGAADWNQIDAGGGGGLSATGTPVDGQIGVWTSSSALEGDSALTFDTTTDTLAIAASGNLAFGAVTVLDDNAGTMTLSNVDALDATTEATIEAAVDTLPNLTSVQGHALTLTGALVRSGAHSLTLTTTGTTSVTLPTSGTLLGTGAAVTVAQGGTGATTLTGLVVGNGTSAMTAISGYAAEATVASATTTDIGAAASLNVSITGTTTITGLGTVAAGTHRFCRFTGVLTFTHNATSLILPGAANITTAAGDRFHAESLGTGNWVVLSYTKADGTAIVGGAGGGDASTNTASSVDSEVALFSGTAGKTIKRATGTGFAVLTSGVLSASSAAAFTSGTATGLTGFALRNAGTGAFDMTETHNGTLTAGRTLTWNLNDAARTVSLTGNLTLAGSLTTSGAFASTFTMTGTTTVTFPTTGTLATLAGTEAFTNKTYNGNTWTAGTGTLTIAAGKTLTVSNSITLAGTDATTMTFPPASAEIGYLGMPLNSQSAAYTLVLADAGKCIYHPSADTTARTWTIPANASVAFPVGTSIMIDNDDGAGALTIAITTDTLVLVGTAGSTGSRTLAEGGRAFLYKVTSTRWRISGSAELT